MTAPQGLITKVGAKFLIDAEPHIMARLRALFPGAEGRDRGRFTHKRIAVPSTPTGAKDVLWLCDRYPIELDQEAAKEARGGAHRYDLITAAAATADQNDAFQVSPLALELALPLREHQRRFRNMALDVRRMLLADKMGLGKTAAAISLLCEPEARPAIIVAPTHLCTQWQREVARFLPGSTSHVIRGRTPYPLPSVDVVITAYSRVAAWQDALVGKFATVIFDEAHDLRHTGTDKRDTCAALSEAASVCVGLTGTPIFNYGNEIWSVLDVISPGCLGDEPSFLREWCQEKRVREPAVLNNYLKSQGLFLRRTHRDTDLPKLQKHVVTLDADLDKLREVEDVARMLALTIVSGNVSQAAESSRDFDWKLRHATGVAKARPVAEFVRMLAAEDPAEKIVLTGWHRDVYEIWKEELKELDPVFFTGSESPAEKDRGVEKFLTEDRCRLFVISLRSGAGLDGLQAASATIVHGELDWSPHVMDQLNARLDREGQTRGVNAYYLNVADGADPFMLKTLNLKRSQHDGLVEGKFGEAEVLDAGFDASRIREMAAAYLQSIGVAPPPVIREEGLFGDVAAALRRVRAPTSTEAEQQDALWNVLPGMLAANVQREVPIGKRGRLDFLVTRGAERVAIECKVTARDRKDVYRQVRRYAEDAGVTAVVLYAPWGGIKGFVVDATPVAIVDCSATAI